MGKFIVIVLAGAAIAAAACGTDAGAGVATGKGQPMPSGSAVTVTGPASSGGITADQITAVAQQAFPQVEPYGYYGVCGLDGNLSACPYTDRLKARLTELRETLLRAQNPSDTREVSPEVMSPDAGVAHVKLFGGREALDLWVVRSGSTVLIDDEDCSGRKDTSIYSTFTSCS